jgi:DNA-binding NarL/FixJ family response regulator
MVSMAGGRLKMTRPPEDRRHLTPREVEVLRLVGQGCSAKSIGRELGLSSKTVDKYVAHAMERFQARNRSHLVAIVTAEGLL